MSSTYSLGHCLLEEPPTVWFSAHSFNYYLIDTVLKYGSNNSTNIDEMSSNSNYRLFYLQQVCKHSTFQIPMLQ
jgi:hypothetical protein